MSALKDRVAIVTGASRGIGRAIALELAARGARVVINYNHNAEAANNTVAAIEAAGGQALAVQADVGDAAQAKSLAKAALEAFGQIDILINNAGITRDGLTMRMAEADWDAVLDTNLKGAFNCAQAVLRPMMKQRYGRIINVSSVSGITGQPGQANYSASKAGMIGLTKALAKEVGSRHITVNAVAPGFIETDLTADLPEGIIKTALDIMPLGRFGKPEEIASAVAFLASDEASYITGEVLKVDGGLAM